MYGIFTYVWLNYMLHVWYIYLHLVFETYLNRNVSGFSISSCSNLWSFLGENWHDLRSLLSEELRTNGPDELLQRNISLILRKLKVVKSKGDPRSREKFFQEERFLQLLLGDGLAINRLARWAASCPIWRASFAATGEIRGGFKSLYQEWTCDATVVSWKFLNPLIMHHACGNPRCQGGLPSEVLARASANGGRGVQAKLCPPEAEERGIEKIQ